MNEELLNYFNDDELSANVWLSKYAMGDEKTPDDMHKRMTKEFARLEHNHVKKEFEFTENPDNKEAINDLSDLAKERIKQYAMIEGQNHPNEEGLKSAIYKHIYTFFKDFKYIVPQGSIMSMLGNTSKVGSLSNCFVIGQPEDSYGGIMLKDEEMVQLMKRRGGVGLDISTLRPSGTKVTNSAGTSTGAVSFMPRYSNTTREVGQDGRRGALMLSISIKHPDSGDFINSKKDRTKITGANISVMLDDEFMQAVKTDSDYMQRFPCDTQVDLPSFDSIEYNTLTPVEYTSDILGDGEPFVYVKKVRAKELYEQIVHNAHDNAEPGQMFVNRHHDYSPDGVYEKFRMITTNPCFHPDTLIETEYGKKAIKDITVPMRVYSMDSDGRLVMSKASPSFVSKIGAKTLKITLKSGASIQVTPKHKLYVHGIGWVKAKDLKINQRLGHLCRSRRGAKYAGVHLTTSPNKQKDQVMEHKLVYGQHDLSYNVHHKDRNTYNNSIHNLELLSHSEHSRLTATEDNPQTHQVRNSKGRFISEKNSKKGKKTIVNMPEELKTNVLSKWHNKIISIEEGETTDVYDIQVEDTHCLIANNIVSHNCGEIGMGPYDACRLMALNLFKIVDNPFTTEAKIDYDLLYRVAYEQQRLADTLVDLELEHIQRIINKILSDPESSEVRMGELKLWEKVKMVASEGRRTGCGFTALGDMLAALGIPYDSEEALETIEKVMSTKMKAELDCTIDLAILRGPFKGWDTHKEYSFKDGVVNGKNGFFDWLYNQYKEQFERMKTYGRRNVSWSTVAPTGSVSILTQTTSGLEPLFQPYYMRRKKINPSEEGVRVDFTDQNGDNWQEFPILHPKFKWWLNINNNWNPNESEYIDNLTKDELQEYFKKSPWYKSTANDIDWVKRVAMQSVIQKYISHK